MEHIDRNDAIRRIRDALKKRTGRQWSVTGGRGTAWGWITIDTTPARAKAGHQDEDRRGLAVWLGFAESISPQSIPASTAYYLEFIDRAEGNEPRVRAVPYWD